MKLQTLIFICFVAPVRSAVSGLLFVAKLSARDRSSNGISVLLGSAEVLIPGLKVAVRVPVILVIRKRVLLLGAGGRASS